MKGRERAKTIEQEIDAADDAGPRLMLRLDEIAAQRAKALEALEAPPAAAPAWYRDACLTRLEPLMIADRQRCDQIDAACAACAACAAEEERV